MIATRCDDSMTVHRRRTNPTRDERRSTDCRTVSCRALRARPRPSRIPTPGGPAPESALEGADWPSIHFWHDDFRWNRMPVIVHVVDASGQHDRRVHGFLVRHLVQ